MKDTKRTRHFPVIIEQDSEGVFLIECPVLKGCRSYGDSVEEALENIREAIRVCLDEDGYPVPETVFLGVRDIEIAI